MEDKNIYFIEAQKRVGLILTNDAFQAEINGTPASLDLFTRANGFFVTSKNWMLILDTSSKAFTEAGVEVKKAAAIDFSITAATMRSYGEKKGYSDLVGLKEFTYTKLYKEPVLDLLTHCNKILDLISTYSVALADYKIDATYTAKLVDLAKKVDDLTKLPQDILKKHASDKKEYVLHEDVVRKFFDTEMDPFMEIYRKFDMTLYLAYLAARKVRHHHLKRKPKPAEPGSTKGVLELLILFKNNLQPAVGAAFEVTSLNIMEVVDADGETYNNEIVTGTYHGKISKEGYKDIEFDFTIVAGQTCAMQFLMETV